MASESLRGFGELWRKSTLFHGKFKIPGNISWPDQFVKRKESRFCGTSLIEALDR
jgi:hypothetical protein